MVSPDLDNLDPLAFGARIAARVRQVLKKSPCDFPKLLGDGHGADPRELQEVLDDLVSAGAVVLEGEVYRLAQEQGNPNWARARAANVAVRQSLPDPNPLLSQWPFDYNTTHSLGEAVWESADDGPAAFLGTPLAAHFYAVATRQACTVLDADQSLLDALEFPRECEVCCYNVAEEIPTDLLRKHSVVVVDPPWYSELFEAFLIRGRSLAQARGLLLCVLPGLLTRPSTPTERDDLLARLLEAGYHVIGIDPSRVCYGVPRFEALAYGDIPGFGARSWRKADLLIARFPALWEEGKLQTVLSPLAFEEFRFGKKRVFLRRDVDAAADGALLEEFADFSKTVSSRAAPPAGIGLWTSDRRGFFVSNSEVISDALADMAARGTYWVRDADAAPGESLAHTAAVQRELAEQLGLQAEEQPPLRRGVALIAAHQASLSPDLATTESERLHDQAPDPFRLEFQRDRDRIMWSRALGALASKTQILPLEDDEYVRRRLTHTMTVSQLALTVARAFGLDPDLTEAIALGHDVGHTPFGHAGESAIDECMRQLGMRGFNHYEHALDVLRWLETTYLSPASGGHPGLNLSVAVYEGIFKHMYHRFSGRNSQSDLYAMSKHRDILANDFCHLEGQAVRIADKVSYLVEDLEDGLRSGVLDLDGLMSCRLFCRAPVDLGRQAGESAVERYISQRPAILSVLMEDLLEETRRRLSEHPSLRGVRQAPVYCVALSRDLDEDMSEVWGRLVKNKLHTSERVQRANARAAMVIRALMWLFAASPSMVDSQFRAAFDAVTSHSDYLERYRDPTNRDRADAREGSSQGTEAPAPDAATPSLPYGLQPGRVSVHDVVMAKDYVASMTDDRAKRLFREFALADVPLR